MDNFMELCLKRQSCRNFSDHEVEHDKLIYCVEAARLAPSACNSQPWSFVVVEDSEAVKNIAKAAHQMNINSYLADAKAFFVVLEEHARLMSSIRCMLDSQYFAKGDIGIATSYLCLAAESQNLGTCIIGIYDRDEIRKTLAIPQYKQIAALIAVGYPADDKVREKSRKPLEEIVRFV